jgi:hypothetical protein
MLVVNIVPICLLMLDHVIAIYEQSIMSAYTKKYIVNWRNGINRIHTGGSYNLCPYIPTGALDKKTKLPHNPLRQVMLNNPRVYQWATDIPKIFFSAMQF